MEGREGDEGEKQGSDIEDDWLRKVSFITFKELKYETDESSFTSFIPFEFRQAADAGLERVFEFFGWNEDQDPESFGSQSTFAAYDVSADIIFG